MDVGMAPTAAISYLIINEGTFAGGAMISASHNPIVENGIKVFDNQGVKISDETEQFVERQFYSDKPLPLETRPPIVTEQPGLIQRYAQALIYETQLHQALTSRVIIDCAYGAVSQVGPMVLKALGIPFVALNYYPDGTNINREAGSEYVRSHPGSLKLHDNNAEVGIAFDGDADRVVFVDRRGQLYDGDMLLAMLSLKLKAEQRLRNDTVIITPMSNSGLADYLQQHGITTRKVRNGDKYITSALIEGDLTLGGEEIGHIIVHTDRTRVTGDGLRTALLILEMLAESPALELQDLAPGMKKYPQIKASIWIGHGTDLLTINDIPELPMVLQRLRYEIPDLTRLECRPASTEPVYRVMIEARTTPTVVLAHYAHTISRYIQQYFGRIDSPVRILDCASGGCIDETAF